MGKTLGIVCGSASVVVLLLALLGMPRFAANHAAKDNTTQSQDRSTVRPEETLPAASEIAMPEPAASMAADPVAVDIEDTPVAATDSEAPVIGNEVDASIATQQDESWYAFWSPFRTELAANGFVERLQQRTGLDYRVVKVDTGSYEVAFAYLNQADIDQKLLAISAATGLELAGEPSD